MIPSVSSKIADSKIIDSKIIDALSVGDGLCRLGVDLSRLFFVVDSNLGAVVSSLAEEMPEVSPERVGVFEMGERVKTLAGAERLWRFLVEKGAKRGDVLVCVGGGVTTDMGGFVAATFKRGIDYVNLPTTLLGAVDAAVGGKTGVDFMGLKNEIGAFRLPLATIVVPSLFSTLPGREVLSGYGEMLKTAFLADAGLADTMLSLGADIEGNRRSLFEYVGEMCRFKQGIVDLDPTEKGVRKALNFGHTIGHAIESLMLSHDTPVTHGHAVILGILAESVVAVARKAMGSSYLYRIADVIKRNYPPVAVTCDDYPALMNYMRHDKKSLRGEINLTMVRTPGEYEINCSADEKEVAAALDIFRDLLGV